jgi:hypothetical protein
LSEVDHENRECHLDKDPHKGQEDLRGMRSISLGWFAQRLPTGSVRDLDARASADERQRYR